MKKPSGWAADTSSAEQSRRAKLNKGKTPWRSGPICTSRKAHKQFDEHNVHVDLRTPKP